MDDILKTLRYNDLLHIYGALLTETQAKILEDYFVFDLSLSEIADSRGVSRAAIEDGIKKGIKKLEGYENAIHALETKQNISLKITDIRKTSLTNEQKDIIDGIERIID